jgi:hypothetical protein
MPKENSIATPVEDEGINLRCVNVFHVRRLDQLHGGSIKFTISTLRFS